MSYSYGRVQNEARQRDGARHRSFRCGTARWIKLGGIGDCEAKWGHAQVKSWGWGGGKNQSQRCTAACEGGTWIPLRSAINDWRQTHVRCHDEHVKCTRCESFQQHCVIDRRDVVFCKVKAILRKFRQSTYNCNLLWRFGAATWSELITGLNLPSPLMLK